MAYDLIGELEDQLAGYGSEIVGESDEVGADEMDALLSGLKDFVGAVEHKRGRHRHQRYPQRQAYQQPPPSGKMVQRVDNHSLRRYPLGLGATVIGPGASAIISANPQLPFRVSRLVTPSVGLLIDNLAVGTVSQFVAAGSVPVEVFAPNAFDVELRGDTAVPGVSVQITISNPTLAPLTFSGAIIGTVAQ